MNSQASLSMDGDVDTTTKDDRLNKQTPDEAAGAGEARSIRSHVRRWMRDQTGDVDKQPVETGQARRGARPVAAVVHRHLSAIYDLRPRRADGVPPASFT
jgi:hypothetical protein